MRNTRAETRDNKTSDSEVTAGGTTLPAAPFAGLGVKLGRTGVVLVLTAIMAAAGFLWLKVLVPYTFIEPIPCPFEAMTGYDCPGCGLQSSLANLFALRWKYVLMSNILSPILLPLFYILVISWSAHRLFGLVIWRFDPPPWVVVVGVIVVVAYGVLRNIPALGVW